MGGGMGGGAASACFAHVDRPEEEERGGRGDACYRYLTVHRPSNALAVCLRRRSSGGTSGIRQQPPLAMLRGLK